MSCCTVQGTGRVFSESAGYYAWKFRRRGLDAPQRHLARALRDFGLDSRSILEIGCGVGGLHLTLLKDGAGSAFGVEVSEGMVAKAMELAAEMGLTAKTEYRVGDFAVINDPLPRSDFVVLDKVLCCYADPEALIRKSAEQCTLLLAVSYPRDAWIARWMFKMYETAGRLLRWSYHPFYHRPSRLDAAARSAGFDELLAEHTSIWQIKVYRRSA
jgi:SAM-dependent methyltransferase